MQISWLVRCLSCRARTLFLAALQRFSRVVHEIQRTTDACEAGAGGGIAQSFAHLRREAFGCRAVVERARATQYPLRGQRGDDATLGAVGEDDRHNQTEEGVVLKRRLSGKITLAHRQKLNQGNHEREYRHGKAQCNHGLRHAGQKKPSRVDSADSGRTDRRHGRGVFGCIHL